MTTHFMDEADILGDRITIMHNVRALPPLLSPSAFCRGLLFVFLLPLSRYDNVFDRVVGSAFTGVGDCTGQG